MFLSPPVFAAIVTVFGLRHNQSRRLRDAPDQNGRPARLSSAVGNRCVELGELSGAALFAVLTPGC